MSDANLLLTSGRFNPKQIAGGIYGSGSGLGALRVSQLEPEGLELTRAGRRFFTGQAGAITGIAPVAAVPSTAAQWTLFNTSTTDSMVLESLGMELASGSSAAGALVMAAFFTAPAQTGLGTNIVAINANGVSTRASAVAIKSGVTISTPAAPSWFVVAKTDSANTGVLSVQAVNNDIKGRIIIPPTTGLALATLSGTGSTPLFFPTCMWGEYALDLE